METMTVEILFFEGCPNSDTVLDLVREVLKSEHITAEVRMVEVRDAQDAVARRFLGSPTIQINGRDVEPEARQREDFGYMCRTYRTASGMAGVPSPQTIIAAVREG